MREIALFNSRGIALIDDEDFDRVSLRSWHFHHPRYASAHIKGCGTVGLHRFIIRPMPGNVVDHANHDGLDNRRANLRECTRSQNAANRRVRVPSSASGYFGVQRYSSGGWKVIIAHRLIGLFDDIGEAARAYDLAALHRWGEFAVLNFPYCAEEQVA
jgi:hypothetical protein